MYFLFDIGGSVTRIAFSRDGRAFDEPRLLPTPKKFEEGIALIEKTARELSGGRRIAAAGGGIAGPLYTDKSSLARSPHLPDYVGKPLKKELERRLDTKVFLENDAALCA